MRARSADGVLVSAGVALALVCAGAAGATARSGAGFDSERPAGTPLPRQSNWEPAVAADPSNANLVYQLITGINAHECKANCPGTSILFRRSTDGGATWGATKLVTRVTGAQGSPTDPNAQWQAWGDVAENGDLTVGYYDRKYGGCEGSGCNDITLARSRNNGGTWTYQRISTGSMPNLTPANNAVQAGFLGDYMWTQAFGSSVHLAWADTRGVVGSANPTPEEDVYYATAPVRLPPP